MKGKIVSVMLCLMLGCMSLAGCGSSSASSNAESAGSASGSETAAASEKGTETGSSSASGEGVKIGVTVQSLSNQVWAGACTEMQEKAKADGNELTYMSCEDNSAKQIEQIENYISSGCDVIMVNPSDPNAIENVCAEAQAAGIKVMCWDNEMENTDLNWVIDNEALGYMIGEQAAEFINEKFDDGKCEVAVLDYPQTEILLERENGILAALKEKAPNIDIVAQQPAIDAMQGLEAMETILQANPETKVVCCIGGGGAVGANEAFKAAGEITDDMGVFAADATDEELASIVAGESNRMSVMITGLPKTIGDNVYKMLVALTTDAGVTEADLGEGETMNGKNVYRNIFPVTSENVSEYYSN